MIFILIIAFALTLIYLSITERTKNYITLLVIQGVLLFLIAFFHLSEVGWFHLGFVLLETLIFKGIVAPVILERVRKHNHLSKTSDSVVSSVLGLLIVGGVIALCFVLGGNLQSEHIQNKFFSIAIATIMTGLILIVLHKNVFTHLIGYLVLENGIFLLSLAVGNEMPMMINAAIFVDIFIGLVLLGVFVNKVGDVFHGTESEYLSQLKD